AAGQLLERQGRELLDPLGALELADGLARKLVQVAGEPGRNQDAAVLRTGVTCHFLRGEDFHPFLLLIVSVPPSRARSRRRLHSAAGPARPGRSAACSSCATRRRGCRAPYAPPRRGR